MTKPIAAAATTTTPAATSLTDLQIILLSTASQRADGSLLPLPASIAAKVAPAQKAMAGLLRRKLAEETVAGTRAVWREDGEARHALIITDAGREAIGVSVEPPPPAPDPAGASRTNRALWAITPDAPETGADGSVSTPAPASPSADPARVNKRARIIKLMRRKRGASLDELIAATGWLPHTTRGAISTLRARGMAIEREKRGTTSYYRIVEEAKR